MTTTQTTTATKENGKPPALPLSKLEGAKIQRIPLAKILPEEKHSWNARGLEDVRHVVGENGSLAGFDVEKDSTGMGGGGEKTEAGLVEAIMSQGQKDPVEVRLNPDASTAGQYPYVLVAGSRRRYALTRIAEIGAKSGNHFPIATDPTWDARMPTIDAIVVEMTEFQARERNLAENSDRDNLTTPDFAWGVWEMVKAAKKEGITLSGAQIASRLNRTPAYVTTILRIGSMLPEKVKKHWREGGKVNLAGKEYQGAPVGFADMRELVAGDEQSAEHYEKEYAKLVSGEGAHSGRGKKGSPEKRKFEKACRDAGEAGAFLAFLKVEGIDPQRVNPTQWSALVERLGFTRAGGKGPTSKQEEMLVDAMKEGYRQEEKDLTTPEDDVEDGGDEGETEGKRAKRDGGR